MPENTPSTDGGYRSRMTSLGLDTTLMPEEEAAIKADVEGFVWTQLVEGYNARQVTEKLELAGWDPVAAEPLVKAIESTQMGSVRSARRKVGRGKIVGGACILVGGCVFTGVTLYMSGSTGFYSISTGAFLIGGWYLVKGIIEAASG